MKHLVLAALSALIVGCVTQVPADNAAKVQGFPVQVEATPDGDQDSASSQHAPSIPTPATEEFNDR